MLITDRTADQNARFVPEADVKHCESAEVE